ncbi:uncharacterized protein At5g01610-like [Impatiens glandulifera]|uniref:uncharacterized protein At5g01610-like n=1 Tax=Impatiens glandulifera TaxID=253017 RepID=UPI001FB16883|nr:uncharacterized protein At5g01610-like [Impatiens glandulifera]
MKLLRSFSSLIFLAVFIAGVVSSSSSEHEDALTVYDVLQQYDFPVGLLPKSVTGYEINRNTGKFKVYLKDTCSYSVEGYQLKYKSVITGVISEDKIYDLKGISVNALLFWWNIQEVRRYGDELQLSVGIASASFGIDEFYESPQCGCGFDCLNGESWKKMMKLNRLISTFLD